jgi:hypothetical protein
MIRDINAHAPLWDSRQRWNATVRSLTQFIDENSLGLLNLPDFPTYIDGRMGTCSTLDLCLVPSTLLACAVFRAHFASFHFHALLADDSLYFLPLPSQVAVSMHRGSCVGTHLVHRFLVLPSPY